MMKTVFINSIYDVDDSQSIQKKLEECYTNTGNLVWHELCKREIAYDEEINLYDISRNLDDSVLVVPVSNNLSVAETTFSKRLRGLLNVKAQIVVIGLGVQASQNINTPKKLVKELPRSKTQLLYEIANKSVSIGVRGEFTAACLDYMGIHNYRIIGCPSFYSGMLNNIEIKLPSAKLQKICMNITGGSDVHKVIELALKCGVNSRLIMQGIKDRDEWVNNVRLRSNFEKNARFFFHLNEWEDYIREEKFTFSFGTRLHGNMLSFLMGVPALWITHDYRMNEIVDLLKLPYISQRNFKKIKYLEELMERCIYDKGFYRNMIKMRREYISFLEENRVAHKFK